MIVIEPLFFMPGQQLKDFEIFRRKSGTDSKGRVSYSGGIEKVGELQGSISSAGQKTVNRWKQTEHLVTHTIIVRGTCEAQEEDILLLNNEKYYIQGKDDPAGLGYFQILYCEKRGGNLNRK